jgi:hypothetical protein
MGRRAVRAGSSNLESGGPLALKTVSPLARSAVNYEDEDGCRTSPRVGVIPNYTPTIGIRSRVFGPQTYFINVP